MVSGLRPETSMVSWREAGEPMRVSGGGGAYQGAVATGAWGWCAHGADKGAWAGVAGGAHGAGAGPVGQGIGNDARWGMWPGRCWGDGPAVGCCPRHPRSGLQCPGRAWGSGRGCHCTRHVLGGRPGLGRQRRHAPLVLDRRLN